jgi:hypothetical protein
MNWEAIGAIGEIVGAGAVVLSLLYLSIQIRQTRLQEKAQASEIVLKEHQHSAELASRPDLAPIISRGVVSFSSLSASEKIQFNGFYVKYIFSFMNVRDHFLAGKIDPIRFETFEKDLVSGLLSPGLREWWNIVGRTHLETKDYINDLLARSEGKVAPYTDYMPGWKPEEESDDA